MLEHTALISHAPTPLQEFLIVTVLSMQIEVIPLAILKDLQN